MKEEIIKLRKKGLTIKQIVGELGCAKSTVSYHINNANLGGKISDFLYGVDDEIIEKIKTLRLENKTYKEILLSVNITEDKLIKVCRKLKLNKGVNINRKLFNNDEVNEYYLKVKSLRQTAKKFNTTRTTLKKIINTEEFKKEKIITKSQAVIDWRKRSKLILIESMGGKCEICGYNKSINALQFHHKNPEEKDFAIGSKSYSIKRLLKEASKCILVCANCHIELHEKMKNCS